MALKTMHFIKRLIGLLTAFTLILGCIFCASAEGPLTVYYGDMNLDGYLSAEDILMLDQVVLGINNPTGNSRNVGDIDKSSEVNSADALWLTQHFLGISRISDIFATALWTAVPMTSAAQAAAGIMGGEGCQWPLFVAFSPTDGDIALMGTDVGGLYRSTDSGKTWSLSTVGLNSAGATGIAFDPNNGKRVLVYGVNSTANENNGLYLSEDEGITWTGVNLSNAASGHRDSRDSIAFDKTSYSQSIGGSSTVYWLTEAGVLYKSTNGGYNWSQVASSSNYANGEVFVNPSNGYVYIASANGFYRSTFGGRFFSNKLSVAITGIDVIDTQPNNVYLSTLDGLYISTDNGNSFTNSKGNNYPDCAYRLEVSPADPNYIVLSNDTLKVNGDYSNNIYYSHDGGANWSKTTRNVSSSIIPYNVRNEVLSWHPTDKNVLLSTGGDMVLRSTDSGKNLVWSNSGYNGACVTSLSYNVNNPSLMYAGNQDYNGFYSVDSGKTWKYIKWHASWGGFTYGGYVVDQNTVVTLSKVDNVRYIYYTTDGGKTIVKTDISVSNSYACVTGVPGDNNIVFANQYRSTDKGVSWSQMNGCVAVYDSDPATGTLYGVNSNKQPVVSTDKGVSWSVLGSYDKGVADLEYDQAGNRLLITDGVKLYAVSCTDGEVTELMDFETMKDGLGNYILIRCIEVDPTNSDRIYVGNARNIYASDVGLLVSEDGGSTWTNLASTKDNIYFGDDGGREVTKMMIIPSTRVLYAAGMCRGIYKTYLP